MNETVKVKTKATMRYSGLTLKNMFVILSILISSNIKPPIMIGMLKRKLNSADFVSSLPARTSEQIVLPEREIPGKTAIP